MTKDQIDLLQLISDFQERWTKLGKSDQKRTQLTGMLHLMEHDKINEDLVKSKETEWFEIQLSYDDLRVRVTLLPLSSFIIQYEAILFHESLCHTQPFLLKKRKIYQFLHHFSQLQILVRK